MGQSISLLAINGRLKAEVLDELGFVESGEPDAELEGKFLVADLPNGWVLIRANDPGYAEPTRVTDLSRGGQVLAWTVEEHVMASDAWLCKDGREIWKVSWDAQDSRETPTLNGDVPAAIGPILEAAKAEQAEQADDETDRVDHFFDVPLRLAEALCGYHPDYDDFEWGSVEFTRLIRSGAAVESITKRGGFLAGLFGRR